MQVANLQWDSTVNNLLFHVLDNPGHGKEFNSTYTDGDGDLRGDNYYDSPPPCRQDPRVEITDALSKLKTQFNVTK